MEFNTIRRGRWLRGRQGPLKQTNLPIARWGLVVSIKVPRHRAGLYFNHLVVEIQPLRQKVTPGCVMWLTTTGYRAEKTKPRRFGLPPEGGCTGTVPGSSQIVAMSGPNAEPRRAGHC
jgi:hypothetical protein